MKLKLTNNAESTLGAPVDAVTTTVLLAPSSGITFPVLGAGEFFPLTLVKVVAGEAAREVVYVTARNVDSCTVMRAQEGTTAITFASGDYAGCHLTAGCVMLMLQKEGGVVTGPLDMTDQFLTQAVLKDQSLAYRDMLGVGVLDYRNGSHQRWAPTPGAQTLSIQNWSPAGQHASILIEGVNLGAATTTLASPVTWIKPDGSHVANTSLNTNHGAALRTSGIDFVLLWTRDGGITIFGKIVR